MAMIGFRVHDDGHLEALPGSTQARAPRCGRSGGYDSVPFNRRAGPS
jgi:hypothetical protein